MDHRRLGTGRHDPVSDEKFISELAKAEDLAGFALAVVAPSEVFRKISQNFSPAGVTSPFMARAMPIDVNSVVPVTGR
jgi:hypothetical protein